MKTFFVIFSLMLSLNLLAQGPAINKDEVGMVLDNMVAQGVISAEQAAAAKQDMQKMGNQDWNELTNKANEVVNRDPEMKAKLQQTLSGQAPKFEGAKSYKGIQKALDSQGIK